MKGQLNKKYKKTDIPPKSGILILNTILKLSKVKNQGRIGPLYLKTKIAIKETQLKNF